MGACARCSERRGSLWPRLPPSPPPCSVEIFIHVAACVKFTEKIKIATEMNVVAVKHAIQLARTFKKLKCMLQVSTAYSQTTR